MAHRLYALRVVLLTMLHGAVAQSFDTEEVPRGGSNEAVPFRAVWERSFCRAMEVLVPVSAERPRDVEHLFKPPCVRLLRCAGCCGDERLQCLPTRTHNTTMQILKVKPLHGQYLEEMTFVQHSACECRQVTSRGKSERAREPESRKERRERRKERQRKEGAKTSSSSSSSSSTCPPCVGRRRSLFSQDPRTCACTCLLPAARCLQRGRLLNTSSCRCERPR